MNKSTNIVRKVDELGRIVLPIEMRKALGIEDKDGLEIILDMESGQIILQKANRMCIKCKSPKNLKEVKPGCYICNNCIEALK